MKPVIEVTRVVTSRDKRLGHESAVSQPYYRLRALTTYPV